MCDDDGRKEVFADEKEGTSLLIGIDDSATNNQDQTEDSNNASYSGSSLTNSEVHLLRELRSTDRCLISEQESRGRRTRLPVITKMTDHSLLDDTYAGVAQTLLSQCGLWDFNTFSLDVSTGGRPLSHLLVHLFHHYNFIDHFKLDIIKVWRCFNLMEAAYHRHNPYHNSVHAADVTQAMHCFLQEYKFAANLTPVETMASMIAAVAHDLDHPGVTQAFLVATSNHLVTLYHNSSVLENHHWRTAISCLSESGIFNHLDREVWNDIQSHIRSLILATDITRQKEFLQRFRDYLSTGSLNMEQTQYRHFALQIALKCADLCNPCRPWPISQRWSYQVCQEFYRQGAYERQLKLPLTPTFDCSTTKVAKIQTDFFQCVVSPLFETWDQFLQTPLSGKLMENLQHNFTQWQQRIVVTAQPPQRPPEIAIDLPQITVQTDSDPEDLDIPDEGRSVDLLVPDVVLKQHRSKSDSGLTPGLLGPKSPHLETYSTEELHPSTTLLSLSSITNTVKLRQVYATTQVDHNLICPTLFQPLSTDEKKDDPCSNNTDQNAQYCQQVIDATTSTFLKKTRSMSLETHKDIPGVHRRASDFAFHVSPLETKTNKPRSHSLVNTADVLSLQGRRRASDFAFHLCPLSGDAIAERTIKPRSQSLVPGLHEYKISFPDSVGSTRLKPRSRSLVPGSEGLTSHLVEENGRRKFSSQTLVQGVEDQADEDCGTSLRMKPRSQSLVPNVQERTDLDCTFRMKPRSQSLIPSVEEHLSEDDVCSSKLKLISQSMVLSLEEHSLMDEEAISSRLKPRSQSLLPSMEEHEDLDSASIRPKPRSQSLVPSVEERLSEIDVSSSRLKAISQSLIPSLGEGEQSLETEEVMSSQLKPRSQSLVQGSKEHSQCLQVKRRASDFAFSVQTEETDQECTDGLHCGTPPELCQTIKSLSESLVVGSEKHEQCTDGSHCGTPPEVCSVRFKEDSDVQCSTKRRASDFAFTVQSDTDPPCSDGLHCGTPPGSSINLPKPRSQSLVHGSEATTKILHFQKRRASDFDFYLHKPSQLCSKASCICRSDLAKDGLPSWCLHISRSFSAERPVRPTLDFDSRQHDSACYNGSRRRGSAPVTSTLTEPGFVEPCVSAGLKGGAENYTSHGRRWSIPVEVTDVSTDSSSANLQPPDSKLLNAPRRSSFGILEPLLAGLETGILNPLGYQKLQPGDLLSPFMSPSRRRGSLPTDLLRPSAQTCEVGRKGDLLSVILGAGNRRRVSGGLEMLRCLWRGAWGEETDLEDPCISYQPRRGSAPLSSEIQMLKREHQPS